jgi:gamma-aminobutyric acid receptor subunit alpha
MNKLSELDMEYSFECYFRQRWTDKRLAFNDTSAPSTLTVNVNLIDRLWKPYTYIENSRTAHVKLPREFA